MKASLKFREEQKPLIKAKIPLSILGLPFQSGITAGDAKELSLNLGTLFDSGPAFGVSYRPNDAFNPFSFVIKTGIGYFGSPNNAPLTMSAEFNFVANNSNSMSPRFLIHFKPNLGDFCLKKSQGSLMSDFDFTARRKGVEFEDDGELVDRPGGGELTRLPLREVAESAVRGVEVGAKTVLPVRGGALVSMRWGVRVPDGVKNWWKDDPASREAPRGVPLLVLNKIGIEHVAGKAKSDGVVGREGGDEVAERWFELKKEVETVRVENAGLGKALEDLKAEFSRRNGNGIGNGSGEDRKLLGEMNDGGYCVGDHHQVLNK